VEEAVVEVEDAGGKKVPSVEGPGSRDDS
jgi:hypothetical protein